MAMQCLSFERGFTTLGELPKQVSWHRNFFGGVPMVKGGKYDLC